MSKHQLCMTKGGTHPGEGHWGKICGFFFEQQRASLVRLLISFLLKGLSFKGRISPLWWGEVGVEDIFGIRGMFATIRG